MGRPKTSRMAQRQWRTRTSKTITTTKNNKRTHIDTKQGIKIIRCVLGVLIKIRYWAVIVGLYSTNNLAKSLIIKHLQTSSPNPQQLENQEWILWFVWSYSYAYGLVFTRGFCLLQKKNIVFKGHCSETEQFVNLSPWRQSTIGVLLLTSQPVMRKNNKSTC